MMTIQQYVQAAKVENVVYAGTPDEAKAIRIIYHCCNLAGVEREILLNGSRVQPYPDLRKCIYNIIKDRTKLSAIQIERILRRKHAFYWNAKNAISDCDRYNKKLSELYHFLNSNTRIDI